MNLESKNISGDARSSLCLMNKSIKVIQNCSYPSEHGQINIVSHAEIDNQTCNKIL